MTTRLSTRLLVAIASLAVAAAACSTSSNPATTSETPAPQPSTTAVTDSTLATNDSKLPPAAPLQATLEAWAERADIPGVIVRIDGPDDFHWSGAAGTIANTSSEPLSVDHPFRIASITKTVTAATVLRLAEDGAIDADATIDHYLPADLVDTVHSTETGGSLGSEITVRQLLGHTSGIHDYVSDPSFVPDVLADPTRVWTPEELIGYATSHGTPHFEPGAGYHYSDTGYVLLGLIVEHATGLPLHQAYRTVLFDPLGMDDTYLEGFEPARGLPLSHPYFGDIDGLTVHHSIDWAGGGLVSTTADLTTLLNALMSGDVFADPATLEDMTQLHVTETGAGYELSYGLGWLGFRADDFEMVGHDGDWGSFMYAVPTMDLTITGTINQFDVSQLDLIFELLQALPNPNTDNQ